MMYQEFYKGSTLLHLPLFALLLFVAVFVGTILWLFVFQRKNPRYDALASLPLEGEIGENLSILEGRHDA